MFDQLLAQQVADNYSINLANIVKSILNLSLNINFSENIIIKAKKKILEKSKKYYIKNIFQVDRLKFSQ